MEMILIALLQPSNKLNAIGTTETPLQVMPATLNVAAGGDPPLHASSMHLKGLVAAAMKETTSGGLLSVLKQGASRAVWLFDSPPEGKLKDPQYLGMQDVLFAHAVASAGVEDTFPNSVPVLNAHISDMRPDQPSTWSRANDVADDVTMDMLLDQLEIEGVKEDDRLRELIIWFGSFEHLCHAGSCDG